MRRKLISNNHREALLAQEHEGEFTLEQKTNGCFPDLESNRVIVFSLKQALEFADFVLHR